MIGKGLEPSTLQIKENDVLSEVVIFTWAVIQYGDMEEKIPVLEDELKVGL